MKIVVIGAGASGLMAAYSAAIAGARVTVLDHNEKPGKKIYITGKGRCNVTNACTVEELISHVYRGGKFLYSAFYNFSSENTMAFFNNNDCPLKIERGNRVFPVSDHASDITKALIKALKDKKADVLLNTKALDIKIKDGKITSVIIPGGIIDCDACIIATGGLSYKSTGSDGSGYEFAKKAGHTINSLRPGLTSLNTTGDEHKLLEGLSLKNITLTIKRKQDQNQNSHSNKRDPSIRKKNKKQILFQDMGELLFTARGISGPLVLRASSNIESDDIKTGIIASIDLKPALDESTLDKRLIREFQGNPNKIIGNVLKSLYPARLTPVIINAADLSPDIPCHDITAVMRKSIADVTKNWCFNITGCGSYNEAVITRGGISLKEVDPSTMASKLVKGLYFAGEILDVDAATGGFNLQIAWSTGYLAGQSAAGYNP